VYLLVFDAYVNEMHGSRSKFPSKKSRPYIYDVKFLALLGAPYIYDISRLRVKWVLCNIINYWWLNINKHYGLNHKKSKHRKNIISGKHRINIIATSAYVFHSYMDIKPITPQMSNPRAVRLCYAASGHIYALYV
jgi:hypothetical protein